MNKDFKVLAVVMVFLIGLISLTTVVSAASPDYDIDTAYLDNVELDPLGITAVAGELGEELALEVQFTGNGDYVDTASARAWIGGYEYGHVEVESGSFDIEPNVTYIKTLNLELPEDMEVCFQDEDYDECTYTLHVEVTDEDGYEEEEYVFFLERPRHKLNILDVLVNGPVEADSLAQVEVRIENLGEKKEEDIKVTLSVDELGISESTYLDELAAPEDDNEDEESSESVFMYLNVPEGASGYYDLEVDVSYDRGHNSLEEVHSLYVVETETETESETETETETESETDEGTVSVNVQTTDMDASVGEEAVFTVTFTNTYDSSKVYTIDVLGEDQWGSSTVDPSVVLVNGGSTEEVDVTVVANEAGEYEFTLQVLDDDGELVVEENLELNAESSQSNNNWLKILFIVIVVIIIIIILIVAFRKMGGDDEEDYDLDSKDGQTYY